MMSFYIYNPQEEAISSSDFIIGVLLWVAQVKCLITSVWKKHRSQIARNTER